MNVLKLTSATIIGYRSIERLSIELCSGLNIVIGNNGAGKSNFLDAIHNCIDFIYSNQSTSRLVLPRSAILHFETESVKFRIELKRNSARPSNNIDKSLSQDKISFNVYSDDKLFYSSDRQCNPINNKAGQVYQSFRHALVDSKLILYKGKLLTFKLPDEQAFLDTTGMISIPKRTNEIWETPESFDFINELLWGCEISFWGETADKITVSRLINDLKFDQTLKRKLKKYSPISDVRFSENINIYKSDENHIIENLRIEFKVNGNWMPWSYLSDGTKRMFYLIGELTSSHYSTALIEEPELGVHPHQFHLLLSMIKEEADLRQIIISTHSPLSLNLLDQNDLQRLLIAKYKKGSGTQIKRLTKAQQTKAKLYMDKVGFLSDYWTMSDLEP